MCIYIYIYIYTQIYIYIYIYMYTYICRKQCCYYSFLTIHMQRLFHEHVLSVRQHVLYVVFPKFGRMQVCHM